MGGAVKKIFGGKPKKPKPAPKPDTSAAEKRIAEDKKAAESRERELKVQEESRRRSRGGRTGRKLLFGAETGVATPKLKTKTGE